ncbi:MAG: SIR2 family protein [Bacillota bacterium]|nr:SIR2 family protein [Bacillota bacterium]MDW7684275.1 SIR2 family protein [Bacillota bacterium]
MDVYLLGAGFSSEAGVPTMKNFLGGMQEAAGAAESPQIRGVFSRAAEYAEQSSTENIEDLLTSTVNDPVFFDLIWAFGLTINHFSEQFLRRCRLGERLGWYEEFARIAADSGARILTFNYDLIVEELLWWRRGCAEDYIIDFDEVRQRPLTHNSRCVVPLYKMHGSVSWLWCLQCYYTVNRYRHVLAAAYEETSCPRCSSRLIPLMIPPTFRKAVSLAHSLQNLWQRADMLFAQADRIVIGGLSFNRRDDDLRQRFQKGLMANSRLQEVVLVNRDEATCRSIAELLPKAVRWRAVSGFAGFCRELTQYQERH